MSALSRPRVFAVAAFSIFSVSLVGNAYAADCLSCGLPQTPLWESTMTSATMAVAIGEITAAPNKLLTVPAVVLSCQHYLTDYVANPEYPGPLLQYEGCVQGGGVPGVFTTAQSVLYMAGTCSIDTFAYNNTSKHPNTTEFYGETACDWSWPVADFGPTIGGDAHLVDYVYGTPMASTGSFLTVKKGGTPIGTYPSFIPLVAKVVYNAFVEPPQMPWCTTGATCGYHWVALPDKNVDAAPTVQCSQSGDRLDCRTNSPPLTADMIQRFNGSRAP